jgi:hypothetical protein
MQNPNPLERQLINELMSEIEATEKNYATIKDILSGVQYDATDVKGVLQSFKDNLSKVSALFLALTIQRASKDVKPAPLPIDSFLTGMDFVLVMMDTSPQQNVGSLLQLAFSASNVKIENTMALLSVIKKTVQYSK